MEDGLDQSTLIENQLDVASLFDSDLQDLSKGERQCLGYIAEKAPVDWFDIAEISAHENITSLVNRRLITRSGDRLNIYWDIFREYLLTGNVPIIPLRYLPISNVKSVIKASKFLSHEIGITSQILSSQLQSTEGSALNICSDLATFEVATREKMLYSLNNEIPDSSANSILDHLRAKFNKHAFTLELQKLHANKIITRETALNTLKSLFSDNKYSEKTWKIYTNRLCNYLIATGLLEPSPKGFIVKDSGRIRPELLSAPTSRSRGAIFTAPASPALVVEVLDWIVAENKVRKGSEKPMGYRNAVAALLRLSLVKQDSEYYYPNFETSIRGRSNLISILIAASKEESVSLAMEVLTKSPNASSKDIGSALVETFSLNWTSASKIRNGGSIRQWASWIIESVSNHQITPPPGRN